MLYILPMLLAATISVTAAEVCLIPPVSNIFKHETAARLANFTAIGGETSCPVQTTLFLAKDGQNLIAEFLCQDSDGEAIDMIIEDGESFEPGNLESVAIVLGLDDAASESLAFGGYDGAYGKKAAVRHYYEFHCSRAGHLYRRYNETPLPIPGFTAEVTRAAGRWAARLVIPLASAGIDAQAKTALHFNAFRFYRMNMYGWHLPAFGGYAAMPFRPLHFLSPAEADKATQETLFQVETPKESVPEAKYFHYYPLKQVFAARIAGGSGLAELRVEGGQAKTARLLSGHILNLEVPCPLAPGAKAKAQVFLDGQVIGTAEGQGCAKPSWADTKAGKEYVDGRVPYPFVPPILDGKKLKLLATEWEFADSALPTGAAAKGGRIISAPIRIEAMDDGHMLPIHPLEKLIPVGDGAIEFRSGEGRGIEIRTHVDFDGLATIRFRLQGIEMEELDSLQIRIPLAKGLARKLIRASSQELFTVGTGTMTKNATSGWLGSLDRGLAFDFQGTAFLSNANGLQIKIEKTPEGTSEIYFNLISSKGEGKGHNGVFQFYLLPTPVRNDNIPLLMDNMRLWFENWSDYQGYPDLAKIPQAKAKAAEEHAENRRFYVYFSSVLAEDAPGCAPLAAELFAPPKRTWYRRAYNPGKDVPCHVICFRQSAGDLILDGAEKLATEADIDGVYLDGPAFTFECHNPSHLCDDALSIQWEGDWNSGRVSGQRAFLKRLRGIFDSRGHKFPLWVHNGGGLSFVTLSLCDYYFDGEQLSRYRKGYLLEPEKLLYNYSGHPFGFRGIFLPQLYFRSGNDNRFALPWSLPHGIESSGHGKLQKYVTGWWQRTDAVFHPYWEKDNNVILKNDVKDALVSWWQGDNEILLVASHLRYTGAQNLRLDLSSFAKPLVARCLNAPEDFVFADGLLSFTVPEGDMRLFLLSAKTPPMETETAFIPQRWDISGGTGEGGEYPLRLQSKLHAPEAYISRNLPETYELDIRLRHSGRLKIAVGSLVALLDGPWRFRGFDEFIGGQTENVAPRFNETTALRICRFADGQILLEYDGHVLFAGHQEMPGPLKISTWAGDTLDFNLVKLAGNPTPFHMSARRHPVP
ncbi:MAG: hypothetical protein GX927_09420 [Lentisphaerae bacterium]|nr:hypothetical protein [Lentisphaerota bacterium]